ncbi:hypothetical protein [Microlunatus sp. GCM10028923]|uniref:hypothetical protein n=1 Tax=Microlunatus sp. GCM10028923 TaxID=3273400 RepID=UPI00361A4DCE
MIITKQLRRAAVIIGIAAATTVLSALAGGTGTANATEPRVSYRQCVGDEYGYGCISEDGKSAFVVDRRCNDRAQAFIRLHNGSGWERSTTGTAAGPAPAGPTSHAATTTTSGSATGAPAGCAAPGPS